MVNLFLCDFTHDCKVYEIFIATQFPYRASSKWTHLVISFFDKFSVALSEFHSSWNPMYGNKTFIVFSENLKTKHEKN